MALISAVWKHIKIGFLKDVYVFWIVILLSYYAASQDVLKWSTHTHGRRMKAKPRKHIKLNCSHLIFETSLALTSSPVFPRLYLHEIKRFFRRVTLLLRSSRYTFITSASGDEHLSMDQRYFLKTCGYCNFVSLKLKNITVFIFSSHFK